jgi:hypothetical protein
MWNSKGLWLRVLLCWALGSTLPFFDEVNQYDVRMRLRGPQPAKKNIVILDHLGQLLLARFDLELVAHENSGAESAERRRDVLLQPSASEAG